MDNLDVLLTKIERQGAGSLIVEAAQYVRQGGVLRVEGEDEGIRVRHGRASRSIVLEHTGDDYSQIVCSRNETRVTINQKVRDLYGFSGSLPQIGEKVQCRFNQHDAELMNGELGFVLDIDDGEIALDVGGRQVIAEFKPSMFNSEDDKGVGAFAHGYAITIHSSQGSEWKKILMFDDITQRNTYSRLAYTGFTRAAEQLTIQI
ncbi:ATP-binding domain-containing protein [Caballeronia sp. GAWG1-1]|nr:ATP-binding domain-containing protein [Caballeronia sp. GAWG1-1]